MSGELWSLMTILGPVLLAIVVIWALMRNRKNTSARDLRHTEEATRENYARDDVHDGDRLKENNISSTDTRA